MVSAMFRAPILKGNIQKGLVVSFKRLKVSYYLVKHGKYKERLKLTQRVYRYGCFCPLSKMIPEGSPIAGSYAMRRHTADEPFANPSQPLRMQQPTLETTVAMTIGEKPLLE
jgi:hypothetical protein